MPTELHWMARPTTAAWYAMDVTEHIPGASPLPQNERLATAAHAWQQFYLAKEIPWRKLSEILLPLSAEFDSPAALAHAMLPRLLSREQAKAAEAAWTNALRSWEQAFASALPQLALELQLRIGPIRELAESYLPGLLNMIGRTSDPALLPASARVVVVPPYRGGYARACSANNTILWEGLLVNVRPQLPEVLRLAWSIAQLNLEVPALVGELPRAAAANAGAWAMIPLVLYAGSELELCRCDREQLALATAVWQPPPWRELSSEQTAAIVWNWYETYAVARPSWPVALAALVALLDAPAE